VIRVLQKDGWRVDSAPYTLYLMPRYVYIDAALSRGVNGSQQHMMIVEVKCFPDEDNTTRDLYIAIGQYLLYRAMLVELEQPYPLYLAVPNTIFDSIFDKPVLRVITESAIKLLVIDLSVERVVQWIE
jgi:hypothetical protein